uniref:PP1c_bdg domain-containing protein n=1 Tax=Anopheles epiroticus TaxID=199890 RepID=A0A182P0K5_9DIPT
MLSERKQCCYQPMAMDNNDFPMREVEYGEWSNQRPTQHSYPIADGNEKLADLKMGDDKPPVITACTAQKRPSIVDNVFNMINNIFNFASRNGTKPDMDSSVSLTEKEEKPKEASCTTSPCIPIFETTKSGKNQLTVPLDYSSTVDDISMTPAGVYVEEMARCERNAQRPGRRKRRKDASRSNQHQQHTGAEGKGGSKNRKEKKRHALRMDIWNDNLALSLDDSTYGYDFRDALCSNTMETHSLPQRCLSSSFSPSPSGSIGSFHDALSDILPAESMHLRTSSAGTRAAVSAAICGSQPSSQASFSATPGSVDTIVEQSNSRVKCDIVEPTKPVEFVVFTDYDVLTTPSASPARRRPPPRNLCQAFSYVWRHKHPDDSQEESDSEEEDDSTSVDNTDEEGGLLDDDDDDDSIVFCEDYDDLNDDSNSSSGFEEKKVRFNSKPVVHVMRAWDFAYRQARKGDWETAARDRERFRKRIADLEPVLGAVLQPTLRDKIYSERFNEEKESNTRARS